MEDKPAGAVARPRLAMDPSCLNGYDERDPLREATMSMRKVSLDDLNSAVRAFLAQASNGHGILVQDGQGRARFGIIPYKEASAARKRAAWKEIQKIQRKVGRMMKKTRRTEEELDRLLQDEE
jgi:hypothetical protein